jgi:hypothetical protein
LKRRHKIHAQFLHSQKHAIYLSINQRFLKIHSSAQNDDLYTDETDEETAIALLEGGVELFVVGCFRGRCRRVEGKLGKKGATPVMGVAPFLF